MPQARERPADYFRDVCFIIMPFGRKEIGEGDRKEMVDFDEVYRTIFEKAVEAVGLPASEGGGRLRPVRTDQEKFASVITQDMFEYIEYSRFALADISAVNANVFYELGARHRAHQSGTAIFRQEASTIPFDIKQVKAFPYRIQADQVEASRQLVTEVLTNSLVQNAWDSPIMLALRKQKAGGENLQDVLMAAEDAVRAGDFEKAHEHWVWAAKLDPDNPRLDLKASAWPKAQGDWDRVIALLQSALAKEAKIGPARAESTYSDAYRELGIAQNQRDRKKFASAGEESLRNAVEYNPDDFDAWASLGGVLRRAGRNGEALAAYERAVEVSRGHPYPLLMALKLRAHESGKWEPTMNDAINIGRAEGFRRAQVEHDPPIDVPWSFYDLSEIQLYLEKPDRAADTLAKGLALSTNDWMPGTFVSAMELLDGTDLPGREKLVDMAKERQAELQRKDG